MSNIRKCPSCNQSAMSMSKRLLGSQRNMSCSNCGVSLKINTVWFLITLVSVAILSGLANILFGANQIFYSGIFLVAYSCYCLFVPLQPKESTIAPNTKPLQWYQSPLLILVPLLIGVIYLMFNYV